MPTRSNFEVLEFDLSAALLRELTALFNDMKSTVLTKSSIQRIDDAQGVYQLLYANRLVYIGKTDAEAGLKKRLARHASKIEHRRILEAKQVSFKAVRVYVFTPMDLEQQLIKYYRSGGTALDWNLSGFGSNDFGRQRDTTKLKAQHFDLKYPVNIDIPIEVPGVARISFVADILAHLKDKLPYTLRYQNAGGRSRKPHPDLASSTLSITKSPDTVRSILQQIKCALGAPWQITLQPGYVILYREIKESYPHGIVIK